MCYNIYTIWHFKKEAVNLKKIYVFGHKKPDTDSVTSSIALSYLKQCLGMNTEPRVLGDINNETKFVLEYFQVQQPKYLNDVKLQIKDLNYRRGYFISNKESILKGFQYMSEKGISTIPVVDDNKKFDGALAMKDSARNQISGDYERLFTSYDHIIETLDGEEILRFDDEIDGELLVASFKSTTFIENVNITERTILIVGDRHSIIEYAVESGAKLLIITGNHQIKEKHIEIARQNKVNIIRTPHSSFDTSIHVGLSNYIKTIKYTHDLLCFDEDRDVNDLIEASNKTRFSYYPIVDKKNNCLGLLKLADLQDRSPKKVILVDHNEYAQSVDGIEEAEILEVVDHHKIGNIGTTLPINFRNMPVGSTNTILYLQFQENHIKIPKQIAGLMLSGIISDTLLLKSPTTTELDKKALKELAKIAEIDYQTYGMEMFKKGSSIKGKTKEEVLYTDFKNFEIDNKKVGIGQINTMDITEFLNEKEEYRNLINKVASQNEYYIVALFVTDIIHNGSYIFYNDSAQDTLDNCFGEPNIEQGTYLDGYVSRKKQIIPAIMRIMERK